ncbi:hypothetical protein HK102_006839 [Quaeritorhiza haematococci]|nr:hypothetical protein HK102_006839 [Quaeritorhiza haematococci]
MLKHLQTLSDSCYKYVRDHGTAIKSLKKFITDATERNAGSIASIEGVELDISEAEANIEKHKRILEDVKLFQKKVWETLCEDPEPSLPPLPNFDRLYNPTQISAQDMEVIGEEDGDGGVGRN